MLGNRGGAPPPSAPPNPRKRRRASPSAPAGDSSLALLARRLLGLLRRGPATLPEVRRRLEGGRRVYDALGVLEGIGAVRRGAAGLELTDIGRGLADSEPAGQHSAAVDPDAGPLVGELAALEAAHGELVRRNRALLGDTEAAGFLYVTYRDVLGVLGGKKVLAVRAPGGSVVGIPEVDGEGAPRYEMSLTTRDPEDAVTVVEIVAARAAS
ncbi:hypothetical protein DFJ74DRAFT_721570 [Hyaloraphidium curvatum]|nr:hypothetical protein DFJ74DRAFT_721570 [Hyaloraphidium curvatum]